MPRFGLIDLTDTIPTLNTLAEKRAIALTVISNDEQLAHTVLKPARFETKYEPWTLDGHEALIANHDACIIPISNNPFTVCKSPNRVILSLWLGVPVVADLIPSYQPFNDCIGAGNWVENLTELAENPKLSGQQVALGRKTVQADFNADSIATRWLNILNHFANS